MGIVEHRIPLPKELGTVAISAFGATKVLIMNRFIHQCNQ